MWPHRRSPQHQQFQELVDLSLCPQVIAGVGPLLSTDADRNDVAVHGEGILVSRVVTRVQDPVAPQAIPFVYEGFSFIGCTGHHQVHYLLTSEHTNLVQVPRWRENPPARSWPGWSSCSPWLSRASSRMFFRKSSDGDINPVADRKSVV